MARPTPPRQAAGGDQPVNPEEPAVAMGPELPPENLDPLDPQEVVDDAHEPEPIEDPQPPAIPEPEPVSPQTIRPKDHTELVEYFINGGQPSCPQVQWDPLTADSQRPPGLTPEAEAWQEAQRALHAANQDLERSPVVTELDAPSTTSPNRECVEISDSEPEVPVARNLSLSFAAVGVPEVSVAGLLLQKFETKTEKKNSKPFNNLL